jgi:hypothetical protein
MGVRPARRRPGRWETAVIVRIVAAAVAVLALMIVIKDGRVLRRVGLTGSCRVVQTTADGSAWAACRAGRLEGLPDLSRRSCAAGALQGSVQYWRCPADVGAIH